MKTREGPGLSVRRHADVVVVTDGVSAPTSDTDAPAPRRTLAVVLLGLLLGAVVATLVLVFVTAGDDEVSTATPAQPVGKQGEPAELTVSVDAPATVVAGRPATFLLRWADGTGTLAGTTEDWGDGVGVGSVAVGQCTGVGPAGPGRGTVPLKHTWSEPGTYPVVLTATTMTCRDGQVVTEDDSQSFPVTVVAR